MKNPSRRRNEMSLANWLIRLKPVSFGDNWGKPKQKQPSDCFSGQPAKFGGIGHVSGQVLQRSTLFDIPDLVSGADPNCQTGP